LQIHPAEPPGTEFEQNKVKSTLGYFLDFFSPFNTEIST